MGFALPHLSLALLLLASGCNSGGDSKEKDKEKEKDITQLIPGDKKKNDKPKTDPPQEASGERVVKKMALLGDSIGVGFLADSKMGEAFPVKALGFSGLAQLLMKADPADVLDGLSKIYRDKGASAFVSFAEGASCFSHSCYLGLDVEHAKSHAVIAHQLNHVSGPQMDALDQDADYIVVEIGANDFCSREWDRSTFLRSYKTLVERLAQRENKPVVLFIPIPDVTEVYKVAPGTAAGSAFNNVKFKCSEFRDGGITQVENAFCPRFLKAGKFTADDTKDLAAANKGIADLVAAQKQPDRILFAESLQSIPIDKTMLAADCFHPNTKAHELMSAKAWEVVRSKIKKAE